MDLASAIQLFYIFIEFNIKVEKFFISHSVLELIKNELFNLNDSINVESTLYTDGTAISLIQNQKDKIINSRKQLLQFERWLKDNSLVETPKEKLEFFLKLFNNSNIMHNYAFDYMILSRNHETVIVTDDFNCGFFKDHCKYTMSFLQYISTMEIDNLNEVVSFLNGQYK